MLREHWLGIRSAFVCQHPFAILPWWWLRLCYISLQQKAHSPICCRSWGGSFATSHHSHFAKTELGFQGSCHTKRMLPSPFFRSAKRMVSSQLEISRGRQSELLAVSFRGLARIAFCPLLSERQTFSRQFQNSLQRSRQLSPSSQDLQHSPTAKCWVALVYHSNWSSIREQLCSTAGSSGITSQPQDDKLIKLQYGKKTEAPGVENRSTEKQNEQWAHMQSSSFGSALNLCFLVQCHCLTANCATYGSAGVQWSHKNLSSSGVPPSPRREMVST